MVCDLLSNLSGLMQEVKSSLLASDLDALSRSSHTLKGLCLNFNAAPSAALAAQLEQCGKRKNILGAPRLVEQLEREEERLIEFLSLQLK